MIPTIFETGNKIFQIFVQFVKATDPIEHGFRFWRQGGEGVVVVGLPEHLQLRGRLSLLTGSAHCRRTRLRTQLVQTRPRGDAVGESEKSYTWSTYSGCYANCRESLKGISSGSNKFVKELLITHLRVQVMSLPVRSLSFLSNVTLSTRSMLDTK